MVSLKYFSYRDMFIAPLAYVLFGIWLYVTQDSLIYLADERAHGSCAALARVEVIHDPIRAYYIITGGAKLAVLYHGNAGNACDRAFYVPMLTEAGYSVLLVEYPGYAGDTERPLGTRMLNHTHIVAEYVSELGYENVVLIGESIGSGFASYHAKITPPNALILITPFDRLSSLAQRVVPLYPAHLLLKQDLRVGEWIPPETPVLILSAEHDEIIPRRFTNRLYRVLDADTTVYAVIPHTTHNTLYSDPRFASTITSFLAEML